MKWTPGFHVPQFGHRWKSKIWHMHEALHNTRRLINLIENTILTWQMEVVLADPEANVAMIPVQNFQVTVPDGTNTATECFLQVHWLPYYSWFKEERVGLYYSQGSNHGRKYSMPMHALSHSQPSHIEPQVSVTTSVDRFWQLQLKSTTEAYTRRHLVRVMH